MDLHALMSYLVPLLVAAIVLRRVMRVQKPRTIRIERLWIFPALLLATTALSLGREDFPGTWVLALFLVSASLGTVIGWFRVHTLEFSLDTESGAVSARATRLGALLIFALIALRYGAELALKKLGMNAGANLVHATDAMLVCSTAMLVARSVHTWIRSRALLKSNKPLSLSMGAAKLEERGR